MSQVTEETLRVKAEEIHNVIADYFTAEKLRVKFPEDVTIDVWTRHNNLQLQINEKKFRWSSEALRIDANFRDWYNAPEALKITFNHGSGGWNKDVEAEDAMQSQVDVFTIGKAITQIIRLNEDTLRNLVDDFNEASNELSELINLEQKKADIKKRTAIGVEAHKFMEANNITAVGYNELMEVMLADVNYKRVHLMRINVSHNGFQLQEHTIEVNRYGKRTGFKINNRRTSRKELDNLCDGTLVQGFDLNEYNCGWSTRREFFRTNFTDAVTANNLVELIKTNKAD